MPKRPAASLDASVDGRAAARGRRARRSSGGCRGPTGGRRAPAWPTRRRSAPARRRRRPRGRGRTPAPCPASGAKAPGDHADGGGLAGAVRAEQHGDLPAGHPQAEAVEGPVRTELLHHALEDDDGLGRGHRGDGSGGCARDRAHAEVSAPPARPLRSAPAGAARRYDRTRVRPRHRPRPVPLRLRPGAAGAGRRRGRWPSACCAPSRRCPRPSAWPSSRPTSARCSRSTARRWSPSSGCCSRSTCAPRSPSPRPPGSRWPRRSRPAARWSSTRRTR